MNGWTEITGENQRFELYRVVVEKKEEKSVNLCSFLSLEAYNLNFVAEKHSFH